MAERLLMIEDDATLAQLVREYLSPLGFSVSSAGTAAEGLRRVAADSFDAVLLDVMLPDLDGFEVCRRIRAGSDVPILMLTARGDDEDRIAGLEIGADDYLPKPFNPRELQARLRAILRRRRPDAGRSAPLRFGRLDIDRAATRWPISPAASIGPPIASSASSSPSGVCSFTPPTSCVRLLPGFACPSR